MLTATVRLVDCYGRRGIWYILPTAMQVSYPGWHTPQILKRFGAPGYSPPAKKCFPCAAQRTVEPPGVGPRPTADAHEPHHRPSLSLIGAHNY